MSKMQGISVKLPLLYSKVDGPYQLNKDLGQVVKQNFKNLVLTSPGERIMLPDFGAGLKRLLFQQQGKDTFGQVVSSIRSQVNLYLPFINIEEISFETSENDPSISFNQVNVIIRYNLGDLSSTDTLKITEVND
jgi:phage baseplate assembly protein W